MDGKMRQPTLITLLTAQNFELFHSSSPDSYLMLVRSCHFSVCVCSCSSLSLSILLFGGIVIPLWSPAHMHLLVSRGV